MANKWIIKLMMLQITINVNEAKVDPRDLMSWGLKMLKENPRSSEQ